MINFNFDYKGGTMRSRKKIENDVIRTCPVTGVTLLPDDNVVLRTILEVLLDIRELFLEDRRVTFCTDDLPKWKPNAIIGKE